MESIFKNAQRKRLKIIKDLSLKTPRFFPLSVVYLWPTRYCPVNCDHCMFASPNFSKIDPKYVLSEKAIRDFIDLSFESKLDTLVISGGGEPMLELTKVLKIIKNAYYKNIEIITSGYWTFSKENTRRILELIQEALEYKIKQSPGKIDFSFRISLDKYHQQKIKFQWLKNLIDLMRDDERLPPHKRNFKDIKIYFRALLIEDDTIDKFAKLLDGKISKMDNLIRKIRFSGNNFIIKVFHKDMRFVGKAKDKKEKKLLSFDRYISKYSDKNNDIRLGMTFLGPRSKGEILAGINVFITYEGKIFPYGGVSDVYGQLGNDTHNQFLEKVFGDIVSRVLLQKGLNFIKRIAMEVENDIENKIIKKNWLASIADESLATAELRLYVTLRLIQIYLKSNLINKKNLPRYLQEITSLEKKDLVESYHRYMTPKKVIRYTYGNELTDCLMKI